MPFRAVLFDLDGVLIDSFDAASATMRDAREHRALPTIPDEATKAVWGQSAERDVELFFPGWTVESFEAFYVESFAAHVDLVKPMPGASSIMDDLDAKGVPTAVITNTPSALARNLLERLAIIPHALVGANDHSL